MSSYDMTSLLLIMALPVLACCITMIMFWLEIFSGSFFDSLSGGNMMFYQHLFWFFGHPEVYMLIIPGFGLVSEMMMKKTNKMMFASDSMVLSMVVMGMLGMVVWGHHMFMVGFSINTKAYFTSATVIMAMPTAMKLMNWWATVWSGCVMVGLGYYLVMGFMGSFSIGGITGLILANCLINTLLHDSYFVVGHFHYVLSLGALYSMFSALVVYLGFLGQSFYNNTMGMMFFSLFYVSSNLVFLYQHYLGMLNFPSSIFNYYCEYFLFNYLGFMGMFGTLWSMTVFYFMF